MKRNAVDNTSSITNKIRIKGHDMAGAVQYHYEPIDPNAISDYLNRDYYTPAPQGGIPLPPRRPQEFYGLVHNDIAYSPEQRGELNRAYSQQDFGERFRNFMPAAMQAYVGTRFDPEFQEITQRNFGPSEMNALQQNYARRRDEYIGGFGVNPLTGFQKGRIPDVSHIMSFPKYSQSLPADAQMSGPGSMFEGVAPFTRGAYYQESPEGIRMRNTYTSPYGQRDVNVLLPMEPR